MLLLKSHRISQLQLQTLTASIMHFSIAGVSNFSYARCLHNITVTGIFNHLLNGVYVRNRKYIVVSSPCLSHMKNFAIGWVRNSLGCLKVFERTYAIQTKLKIFPESMFLLFVIENMFVIKFYFFITGIPNYIYSGHINIRRSVSKSSPPD